MNRSLQWMFGYEDIGLRFSLTENGLLKISLPKGMNLSEWDIENLTREKAEIIKFVKAGMVMKA